MHVIQQHIKTCLDRYPAEGRYIIAFSGGCDSVVLLHALHALVPPENLLVVHINHGLQSAANQWDDFCKNQVETLNIAYVSATADLHGLTGNIEERARKERYRLLARQMSAKDILITAHHQNDQAETLLLQLMRGSGVDGLGGMNEQTVFKPGLLIRPLLNISRAKLETYAADYKLEWVDDPSNADNSFDRNFLRNEIIPHLKQRWPSVSENIARSASNCQEAGELVKTQSNTDLLDCLGSHDHILLINKLKLHSTARQHHIIRSWVQTNDMTLPDRNKVETICNEFIRAREDAQPVIKWSEVELYRFKRCLYLLQPITARLPDEIRVTKKELDDGCVNLPEPAGRLLVQLQRDGTASDLLDFRIRFRSKGEKVQLKNRKGTRKLKKLFQEWGIPPWMRGFVPLVYLNGQCIAIADFSVCHDYDESIIQKLTWQPVDRYMWE